MKPASGLAFGLALACSAILSRAADSPSAKPPAASKGDPHLSPVLLVPAPMAPKPIWQKLEELERNGHWAESESVATDLVGQLESSADVDSLDLSRALLYIANARTKLRIHADGKGFGALERGIGIRERNAPLDDPLTLWAHTLGGTFYGEAGRPDLACAHAETAVVRLQAMASPDSLLLSQAWLGEATSAIALGRTDEARTAYDTGLALREAVDGPTSRSMVPLLAEYGLFLSRVGEFDHARELLRRAIHIAEVDNRPGSDYLMGSLSRLSTVENRAGDVAESLDLAQRAYELSRASEGEDAVSTLRYKTILAYRHIDLGDYRGAARLLREIVPAMASVLGDTNPQSLMARLSLVECLLDAADTTSVAHELDAVHAALAQQQQLANSNDAYSSMLDANFAHLRGNDDEARGMLESAIARETQKQDPVGDHLAVLYTNELNLMHESSDRERVTHLGKDIDALANRTVVRATPEWIELLTRRAGAEARVGMRDDAWAHALDAEARARERMTHQLQALPDASALRLAQNLGTPCEVLVRAMRVDDEDQLAAAWDRVVRWRGLVRHEISRRRPVALAAADTAVAGAHARWLTAQRRLGQLVVSGVAHPDDPETAERYAQASRDAEEAERRYVRAARGMVPASTPVGVGDVIAALKPGQAVVAFAIGSTSRDDATLGAFVVSGSERRIHWVPLGGVPDLAAAIGAWKARLAVPPLDAEQAATEEQACRALGEVVAARVWSPLISAMGGATEIFLISEGPVNELPWWALPTSDHGYLADEPVVLHLFLAERDIVQPTGTGSGTGLLAVGGPDFDLESTPRVEEAPMVLAMRSRQWPCLGTEAMTRPPLPGALSEVEELARVWPRSQGPVDLLTGKEASEAAFKKLAPGHAVLHLATHGVVVDEDCIAAGGTTSATSTRGVGGIDVLEPSGAVARSAKRPWLGRQVWLALAGASRPPSEAQDENEGLLTAEEVVTLDLRGTQWVVLSACHSALAPSWAREGILGMRRAFHIAGAQAVIASQWPVADDATREWMTALYEARAQGASAGAAVAQACRATLAARRADGRSTHPFYWAAFSATGD